MLEETDMPESAQHTESEKAARSTVRCSRSKSTRLTTVPACGAVRRLGSPESVTAPATI